MLATSMWTSYLIELLPEDMVKTYAKYGWRASELSDEHARPLKRGKPAVVGRDFQRFAADPGMSFPKAIFSWPPRASALKTGKDAASPISPRRRPGSSPP